MTAARHEFMVMGTQLSRAINSMTYRFDIIGYIPISSENERILKNREAELKQLIEDTVNEFLIKEKGKMK